MPKREHVFQRRRMSFIQHVLPIHFSGTLPTVFLLELRRSPAMARDGRPLCHLSWLDEKKVRRYEPWMEPTVGHVEMMLNQMKLVCT